MAPICCQSRRSAPKSKSRRDFAGGLNNISHMKNLARVLLTLILAGSVLAQDKKEEKAPAAEKKAETSTNEVAVIKTSEGEMVVEFWSDVAPKTVENFKTLAKKGFYDGTAFHRIIKGFMIQGGDPLTKDITKEDMFGTGDPGYKIKAEFNNRKHETGVLSMARSRDPDSAGSQFFICLGRVAHLDNQYTAFGKVIKGEDVLMKIGNTPVTTARSGESSKPTKRVEVQSVKIVPADSIK
jgi:peptidyl-prolyl cis-trans isomerase B (cyclophilin B)